MIEFVFLDLDDTILDFRRAEREALSKTLVSFGVTPEEAVLTRYHQINKAHWEMLERGQLRREEVLVNRFAALFRELGLQEDAAACAARYEGNLAVGHWFLPGAQEALEALHKKYRLFLASNGTAAVQRGRMTSAGLYPYFEQVFISQQIGYNKPDRAYFQACFARIPDFCPERAVMVGDSLTSDIQGGINAGITTVWVNPEGQPRGAVRPDYEIQSIAQLERLLEQIREEQTDAVRAGS